MRAILLSDIKNAHLYRLGRITDPDLIGVTARDRYTLEFVLENPTAHFIQLSGTSAFHPIPRHTVIEFGDGWTNAENFVSNGPFQLHSWVPGESMVLKKNLGYHGEFGGNLPGVEITFTNQVENPLRAYLDGDFDFLPGRALTSDQLIYVRQYLGDEYYSVNQLGTSFLGFDTKVRPFDDPRVRRAIALATDRDALISRVFMGFKSPASGGFVPPGIPGHSPDIALPYDPHYARKLLAEAGFRAGKGFPVFEGVYAGSVRTFKGAQTSLANHLQDMWLENLGIRVNWALVSRKEMFQRLIGNIHSVISTGWIADYNDPHNFFVDATWYYPKVVNENQWDYPKFLNLIQKAKGVLNQEERIKLYRQADQMIVEEAPILPLYYDQTQRLQKPWVKGVSFWPAMAEIIADIIIEEH
jgi:oligopeptide transport system substrate-binding protein